MSPDRFPEHVDPHRIFARNGIIDSEVPLSRFGRLRHYLSDTDGSVSVHLDFGYDENQRRRISGTLKGTLKLQCQRCLETMPWQVDSDLQVLVMRSDAEAATLPVETEAVVADDEELALLALVEDELILSLPLVPYHEDAACNEKLNNLQADADKAGKQEASPFAGLDKKLAQLKVKGAGSKDKS